MKKAAIVITLILYSLYSFGVIGHTVACGENNVILNTVATDASGTAGSNSDLSIGCCESNVLLFKLTEYQNSSNNTNLITHNAGKLILFPHFKNGIFSDNENTLAYYPYSLNNPPPVIHSVPLNVLNEIFLI